MTEQEPTKEKTMSQNDAPSKSDDELRKKIWTLSDNYVVRHAQADALTTDLLHLFQVELEGRERRAERQGEVSQLKFLRHWASLYELSIDIDDLQYFIDSLEQLPEQPLARENLEALLHKESQEDKKS